MPCNETTLVCIFAAAAAFFCILSILFFAAVIKKSKELKKFRKESSLFLSSAAHDLKSPLTNIKGYADAMLAGDFGDTEKDDALSVISFEAERLSKITSRLCDGFAAVENGGYKLSMSVFGICDALHYVGSLLEKKARRRDIEIIYSFPAGDEIYVFADKDAIIEAVYNLFDNAVKYCIDGGKTEISAIPDYKNGVCVTTVRNTAFAFADTKSEIPSYFKAGFSGKASAPRQKQGQGHGLGLYIAHELINAHGKEIVLSVEPQQKSQEASEIDCGNGSRACDKEITADTGEIKSSGVTEIFSFSFCLDLAPDEHDGKALAL